MKTQRHHLLLHLLHWYGTKYWHLAQISATQQLLEPLAWQ